MSIYSPSRTFGKTALPLITAVVWTLAAASTAYWILHWPKAQMAVASSAIASSNYVTDSLYFPMARALGQTSTKTASPARLPSTNYILTGVIASASGQGSALIATDGQPPKAFKVGQTVQDGWTLVSLTARQARLKSAETEVLLELPPSEKP
jgi:general secretion pathway protein C